MMENCETIDIEAALQAHLEGEGYRCATLPKPADISPGLVIVQRTGGMSRAYVQDVHYVSVDCYGETCADAMKLADGLTRVIRALPPKLDGVAVYESDVTGLPYDNPDPQHYSVPRATFQAQIATRVRHV